ncbi:hypothetical protein TSMEX_007190 [Taenia solium]|eukprot:TsM_000137600 transcript=TsM_000137600 gene=TsM_000137600
MKRLGVTCQLCDFSPADTCTHSLIRPSHVLLVVLLPVCLSVRSLASPSGRERESNSSASPTVKYCYACTPRSGAKSVPKRHEGSPDYSADRPGSSGRYLRYCAEQWIKEF